MPIPLPARPNLEFEHKRAKKRLRALQAADPSARLADAQFAIAREYGFASWPKLVAYYSALARDERTAPRRRKLPLEHYDARVRHLMTLHARRQPMAAQILATYVPRLYGRSDAEIFDTPLDESEARLASARFEHFASWEALVETPQRTDDPPSPQRQRVGQAMREADLDTLAALLDADPTLLEAEPDDAPVSTLLWNALLAEERDRTAGARAVTDLLVARGCDLQLGLNVVLTRGFQASARQIAYYLERGADPAWVAPNGWTVLDHALVRYWNGDAADVVARRVTPRRALWVAAGLGDVAGVRAFLAPGGGVAPDARHDRPDFVALSPPGGLPCRPDADDAILLWEAWLIAGMNQRLAVLDVLLEHGFPIDAAPWGSTLLRWAHGNRITVLVDHLTRRGAA